jgi:lipopolysaccharide/colanic/teichoic acid biosynthesis glycosyltransferase
VVPAFYKRRQRRSDELGQLLMQSGALKPELLREALRVQEEQGGQLGATLIAMRACSARAIADAIVEQSKIRLMREGAVNVARLARENPAVVGLRVHSRPWLTRTVTVASDAAALVAGSMIGWLAHHGTYALAPAYWLRAAAVTVLCVGTYALQHLYGTPPPRAPDEMRRVAYSTLLVGLGVVAFSLVGSLTFDRSVGATMAGCTLSIVLVLLGRGLVRRTFGKRRWWGIPVVVFGAGHAGRSVVRTLRAHTELGLKPVAILDDDEFKHGTLRAVRHGDDIEVESVRSPEFSEIDGRPSRAPMELGQFSQVEGVPIIGTLDLAPVVAPRLGIETAVIALNDMHASDLANITEGAGGMFKTVLVVPELFGVEYLGDPTRNLGGVLGIEIRRPILSRWPTLTKRTVDIAATVVGGLFILPLLALIAVAIAMDSPGPIFYRQKRLGLNGRAFEALKFRTMYGDGELRLQQVLDSDPGLRAEYEQFHKLTVDARVTRVGRFLRKYSLDELPQVYNVLIGDMSLVGPRPYLERELPEMDGQECIVLRVRPGITGLWQVSDRNATTFRSRVKMDVEYVRNWSPWLDLYLLIRTVEVVVAGTGS